MKKKITLIILAVTSIAFIGGGTLGTTIRQAQADEVIKAELADMTRLKQECIMRAGIIKALCDATDGYDMYMSGTNWDAHIAIVCPTVAGTRYANIKFVQ